MKNVFVEGLQGMGKSTLVGRLAEALPQLRAYREGDYSPVELAWCAHMTAEEHEAALARFGMLREEILQNTTAEGDRRIVTYTKIRTDVPDFYRAMEDYEIYNGRRTLDELREIVCARYSRYRGTGGLFECAFFQNIVEDLILYHQLSDEEIVEFYRGLWACVDREHFLMLYLSGDAIEENIGVIRRERCDGEGNEVWYAMMLDYLTQCPYGKAHGYAAGADLAAHMRHRQRLELRIIREVLGDHALVLPAKAWSHGGCAGGDRSLTNTLT